MSLCWISVLELDQSSILKYVSFFDIENLPKVDLVIYLVYFRGIISGFLLHETET